MNMVFIVFCVCLWRLVDVTEEMKSVAVIKGDSVTLHTGVTEKQRYLLIQWSFGSSRIAEVSKLTKTNTTYGGPDERFKDRLHLDQTGSLTIADTRTTDSGLYELKVINRKTSSLSFSVTVYETAQSLLSPETSSSTDILSSILTVHQTENVRITDGHQPKSDVTEEIKSVAVIKGESVTLHTDVTKVQRYLLIQWMFGSSRIAEVSKLTKTNTTYGGPDERFRDRLHLDHTGSLTITDTRTTDSGLYKLVVISGNTSYLSFSVTVYETPQTSPSPSTYFVSSILTVHQTENVSITEVHQSSSGHIHCCGFTETVFRLVLSALVSVAAVVFLVYDIRSSRNELKRMEETRHHHLTHRDKTDQHQYELSRRLTSRYVC